MVYCPNLNQLRSLTLSSYADIYQSQLQTLLDQAHHLNQLDINQDTLLPLHMPIIKYTNASICQLDLISYNHCFNEDESITLTSSLLDLQCEVLSIWNNNRQIINVIKNMPNLRALNVKYVDKNYYKQLALTTNKDDEFCDDEEELNTNELIQCLKVHLPSTHLMTNDTYYIDGISIWI